MRGGAARVPELNATLDGDEIVYLDRYDIGLAVQTEQGLLVPVVRGGDPRSLDELAAEVDAPRRGCARRHARPGGAARLDLHRHQRGKLGGLLRTPLVNHPEVAILGVHRIAPRPVVRDGEIVVRAIGRLVSRSTTASSTGPGDARSCSTSSTGCRSRSR